MDVITRIKIDEWLANRRMSDGGYANITPDDITNLNQIIELLVEEKCEKDPDGDRPIEWELINRHTHKKTHFAKLDYDVDEDNPLAYGGKIRTLMSAVNYFSEQLRIEMNVLDFHNKS